MSNRNEVMAMLGEQFVLRMRNWARAQAGSSAAFAGGSVWNGFIPPSGYHEAPIPILAGEATDTDKALQEIPARERQAVMLFWQYEGAPLTYLGQRCRIDYRTYAKRVMLGHELLKCIVNRMAEAARIAREHNEKRTAEAQSAALLAHDRAAKEILRIRLTR